MCCLYTVEKIVTFWETEFDDKMNTTLRSVRIEETEANSWPGSVQSKKMCNLDLLTVTN